MLVGLIGADLDNLEREWRLGLTACVCTLVVYSIGLLAGIAFYSNHEVGAALSTPSIVSSPTTDAGNYATFCSRPASLEEADLCQQWRAAEANSKAVEIGSQQVLLGWAGAIGLLATILIATATYLHGIRSSEKQIRAYMTFEACTPCFPALNIGLDSTVAFKNTGQTPAFDVKILTQFKAIELPAPPQRPVVVFGVGAAPTLVGPGQETRSQYASPEQFSAEGIAMFMEGKAGLLFFGDCFYRDALGKKRRTSFAVLTRMRGEQQYTELVGFEDDQNT